MSRIEMHRVITAFSLFVFSGFIFPNISSAQASPAFAERHIVADFSKPVGPHSLTPLQTVGAGRANEGLRADWQAQLETVQKEIGFKYIRFHGLLDDDMGVYTEDKNGIPQYNFQYVDVLYDALLAHHIRPFVELSFMPSKLASGPNTVFWYNANVTPPKDMAKWQGLIVALMQHWLERYGQAEIESWYYEVWNEPDLPAFYHAKYSDYFNLYEATADGIKQICPKCRVGGPATASGHEAEFLEFVAKSHSPIDFISTHSYPSQTENFTNALLCMKTTRYSFCLSLRRKLFVRAQLAVRTCSSTQSKVSDRTAAGSGRCSARSAPAPHSPASPGPLRCKRNPSPSAWWSPVPWPRPASRS